MNSEDSLSREKKQTIRKEPPKPIKEQVLKEYSHCCAICSGTNPQIHHIDENPQNNEVLNLIPLCPNCHNTGQHNKYNKIPENILKLFRKYNERKILDSKFIPIYKRMNFLFEDIEKADHNKLQADYDEFMNYLPLYEKGEFYKKQIEKLLFFEPEHCVAVAHYQDPLPFADVQDSNEEYTCRAIGDSIGGYKKMYKENKEKVIDLVIEMLKYQDWSVK